MRQHSRVTGDARRTLLAASAVCAAVALSAPAALAAAPARDSTFGGAQDPGTTSFGAAIQGVAATTSGYLALTTSSSDMVVHVSASGTGDTSFPAIAVPTPPSGYTATAAAIAPGANGSFFVGGFFQPPSSSGSSSSNKWQEWVEHFSSAGSADSGFGTEVATLPMDASDGEYGLAIATQPNGGVILATAEYAHGQSFLTRFTGSSASPDSGFGTQGVVTFTDGTQPQNSTIGTHIDSIVAQASNDIIAVGGAASGNDMMWRFNGATGSQDASFGNNHGATQESFMSGGSGVYSTVSLAPDGSILVGSATDITPVAYISHFDAGGNPIAAFNGTGTQSFSFPGTGSGTGAWNTQLAGIAEMGGDIVLVATPYPQGQNSWGPAFLAAETDNGAADTTIGAGGEYTDTNKPFVPYGAVFEPSTTGGRIVLAGSNTFPSFVATSGYVRRYTFTSGTTASTGGTTGSTGSGSGGSSGSSSPDATTTSVSCAPASPGIVYPDTLIGCNVVVTDTSSSPSTPTGTVSLASSNANGTFDHPSCRLGGDTVSRASCSVDYTASQLAADSDQTDSITGTYSGDSTHSGSASAAFGQLVSAIPTGVSVACAGLANEITRGTPTTCRAFVAENRHPSGAVLPHGVVAFTYYAPGSNVSHPLGTCTPLPQAGTKEAVCEVPITIATSSAAAIDTYTVQAVFSPDDRLHYLSSATQKVQVLPPAPVIDSFTGNSPQAGTETLTAVFHNESTCSLVIEVETTKGLVPAHGLEPKSTLTYPNDPSPIFACPRGRFIDSLSGLQPSTMYYVIFRMFPSYDLQAGKLVSENATVDKTLTFTTAAVGGAVAAPSGGQVSAPIANPPANGTVSGTLQAAYPVDITCEWGSGKGEGYYPGTPQYAACAKSQDPGHCIETTAGKYNHAGCTNWYLVAKAIDVTASIASRMRTRYITLGSTVVRVHGKHRMLKLTVAPRGKRLSALFRRLLKAHGHKLYIPARLTIKVTPPHGKPKVTVETVLLPQ
jgi:hypothetical protein